MDISRKYLFNMKVVLICVPQKMKIIFIGHLTNCIMLYHIDLGKIMAFKCMVISYFLFLSSIEFVIIAQPYGCTLKQRKACMYISNDKILK